MWLTSVIIAVNEAAQYPTQSTETLATAAVIGAAGYIGSRLHKHLNSHGISTTGFDRDPRDPSLDVYHLASYEIPDETLRSFDAVVFLGGLTGRKACEDQ